MHKPFKSVRDMVRTCPLPLIDIADPMRSFANEFLPYETGIEIECDIPFNPNGPTSRAMSIDMYRTGVLHFEVEGNTEIKFRIPSGIKGMCNLYNALEVVKAYCKLNMKSGIHYHIDMRKCINWDNIRNVSSIESKLWILKALDRWGYKGTYNHKNVAYGKTASWVNLRPTLRTMEFRVGEMSFDYQVIIKRIINCQNIVRRFSEESLRDENSSQKRESYPKIVGYIHL